MYLLQRKQHTELQAVFTINSKGESCLLTKAIHDLQSTFVVEWICVHFRYQVSPLPFEYHTF